MQPGHAATATSSEEQAYRARLLRTVAAAAMAIGSGVNVAITVAQPALWRRTGVAIAVINVVCLLPLAVARRGRTRLASWMLVSGLVLLVTGLAVRAGGIRSPGVAAYFVFVMMAGLLLGDAAAAILAAVCVALGLGLALAETVGLLPPQTVRYSAMTHWLLTTLYIGLVVVLMRVASKTVREALVRAEAELTERRRAERERERLLHDLGERVKELRLLHAASRLLRERPYSPGVLSELVELMPAAWAHPEVCEARLTYRDVEARTRGWRETPWRLSTSFQTRDGRGVVEVVYLEERPPADEGPFLAEERALIGSLAEMLAAYIDRHIADRQRTSLEGQLRQSQKMEALGTLAGGIAHDFNNILTAIGGNLELALEDVGATHPARGSLEEIARAQARATELIKRILLLGRPQDSRRETVALTPIVEEALRLVRATVPSMIQIRAEYAPGVPPVSADPTQLHQIVMNLSTNAAHAMSAKGGVLAVDVSAVRVEGDADAPSPDLTPGTYACLAIGDTGTGMSRDILDRIFEPFFTTKGHAGTGLGLAVVHGIVRDLGGAITVRSEVGQGTTFTLYLPAAKEPAAAAGGAAPAVVRGREEHVMYVDDEEAVAFVLSRALRRLGYRCTMFTDPAAALHAFRTSPRGFDAVITDYAMPGMTGTELARAMRALRPDVPIAIASGYESYEGEGPPPGAPLARLRKPVSLEALSRVLAAMLRPAPQ